MQTQHSIGLGADTATPGLDSRPLLDHLILLVASLEAAQQHFASLGFTVKPGGRHADGVTENCLVVLPDGVYIEIIAFVSAISPEQRQDHWWGNKTENGWIDWSLTPPTGKTAAEVVEQAVEIAKKESGNERWDEPKAGGRATPEGKELKWEVSFPQVDLCGSRGRLPFICADKTHREWRVPPPSPMHANEASGIAVLEFLAQPTRLAPYAGALSSMLEPVPPGPSSQSDPGNYARHRRFMLRAPKGGQIVVIVREPEGVEEEAYVRERGEGLYSVGVKTYSGQTLEDSKLGRISLI